MKKTRTITVVLLAMAMVFCLASCTKNAKPAQTAAAEPVETAVAAPEPVKELTPEEKLRADVWCFKYTAEGYGDFSFYFKFYDEDPLLGKVFFAGLNNNRNNFAGTYKLIERDYEYGIYLSREDAVAKTGMVNGTVPYTVVMYDWDGNVLGSMGFDGEKLYNAQDKTKAIVYSTGSTPYAYEKNTGSFDSAIAGETGVVIYEYTAFDDVTSTIQINHNHTYTDLVAAMIEGSWKAEKAADGTITFDLTPNDKTDTPATLVVSADGKTATYTAQGESAVEMGIPQPTVTVAYSFEGTSPTSYGKDATIKLDAMSDGTFTVTVSVFGSSSVMDQGTYTVEGGYKFAFTGDNSGAFASKVVDRAIQIEYKLPGTKVGDLESILGTK